MVGQTETCVNRKMLLPRNQAKRKQMVAEQEEGVRVIAEVDRLVHLGHGDDVGHDASVLEAPKVIPQPPKA